MNPNNAVTSGLLQKVAGKLLQRIDALEQRIAQLEGKAGVKSATANNVVRRDVADLRRMRGELDSLADDDDVLSDDDEEAEAEVRDILPARLHRF